MASLNRMKPEPQPAAARSSLAHALADPSVHGHASSAGQGIKVPPQKEEREAVRAAVRQYVVQRELVPPLSIEELRGHADAILAATGFRADYRDFITVLTANAVWWDTMAGIPYDRRVLMLPQCLRDKKICPAPMDKLGLLCEQCGQCPTGGIQARAEQLGYVVLVAEGTTVVTRLLEQGTVDAVIGVSCLSVLERAFPHMAAHAIPGLALPLVRDGCENTAVDLDWVVEAIQLKSNASWLGRVDIDRLKLEVETWFQPEALRAILALENTQTGEIALGWLSGAGKRWRPVLAACVYRAVTGLEDGPLPDSVRKLAVAMECFHKASLVHDDIEDEDSFRYGSPTVHQSHGIPIAVNIGDFLLGEGYRLVAASGAPPAQVADMLAVVAEAHHNLCLGQGEELCWMRDPGALSPRKVLELFRRKTAPAFEVALRIGALCGQAGSEVHPVLKTFSESLGIAFQIRDDLDDLNTQATGLPALQPSILQALAYENAAGDMQAAMVEAWKSAARDRQLPALIRSAMAAQRVEEKAQQLLEHYKNEAIRSLSPLRNAQLKGLLRRLVGRIVDAG